mmetsp:Transcript_28985/g.69870  ORF Transcript_28985/g.69870 Transcript_28985/m.69870 type:complete len:87 (-) Transcript_28985:33-293(-)
MARDGWIVTPDIVAYRHDVAGQDQVDVSGGGMEILSEAVYRGLGRAVDRSRDDHDVHLVLRGRREELFDIICMILLAMLDCFGIEE